MISKALRDRALIGLLGLLTTLDILSIDMYLPSFPALARDFAVTPDVVQQTLAVFLLGLAVGQGTYGPLMDRYGRRAPLLAGIVLYVVGSALAALAPSIHVLLSARLLQALGASAGLVAPRAIVVDLFDERASSRIFSRLMQIIGVGPVIAPILGQWLLGVSGWRFVFWMLSAMAVLCLLATVLILPETQPAHARGRYTLAGATGNYAKLLRNPGFMADACAGGFIAGALFAYIASSPFVFVTGFGLSPGAFSLVFAANAAGMIVMAQVNLRLLRHRSERSIPNGALVVATGAAAALWLICWSGVGGLLAVATPLLVALWCLGLTFGNNVSLAMAWGREHAGAASALVGVVQYALGAAFGALSGWLAADAASSMALIMLGCLAAAAIANWIGGRVPRIRGTAAATT